jgi:hypothetical protein
VVVGNFQGAFGVFLLFKLSRGISWEDIGKVTFGKTSGKQFYLGNSGKVKIIFVRKEMTSLSKILFIGWNILFLQLDFKVEKNLISGIINR